MQKIDTTKTLVIIPALNEAKTLQSVIREIKNLQFKNIVVVNDGSADQTQAVALKNQAICLNHCTNQGMGAATQTGIEYGLQNDFKYFLTIDADNQHISADLLTLQKKLFQNYDCVIGSRFLQSNKIPPLRRIANKIANYTTGILFGVWVTDSQSGLRGFNRKVAQKLNLHATGFEYCSEFIREVNFAGFKIKEIPITINYTTESLKKGQNFAAGLTTLSKLILRAITR